MKATIRLLHHKAVTFVADPDWKNEHVRYMLVAICSGLLNLSVYIGLSLFRPETAGLKWYAVLTGGAFGFIGHKLVSYGYGEKLNWKMIPAFIAGMFASSAVYLGVSTLLVIVAAFLVGLTPWSFTVPYLVIHVTSMFVGFVFFQQFNLHITFRKTNPPDSPAVIRVELSDE